MKELFAAERDGKETSTTEAENLVATVNNIFNFLLCLDPHLRHKNDPCMDCQEDGDPM